MKPFYELDFAMAEDPDEVPTRYQFPRTDCERKVIREFAKVVSDASVCRATLKFIEPQKGKEPTTTIIAAFKRDGIEDLL